MLLTRPSANITQPNVLAANPQALDGLRALASKGDDKAALKAGAQQFEAFFLQMMMKSMRATINNDGPFDTQETRAFTEMFDQQVAMNVSRSKGVGLADMLVKQLEQMRNPDALMAAPRSYDLPSTVGKVHEPLRNQQGSAAYRAISDVSTKTSSSAVDLQG